MSVKRALRQTKKSPFWSGIFCAFAQHQRPILHWIVICDEKCILWDNWRRLSQWLDRDKASKQSLKLKLHQKCYGDCLMVHDWSDPSQFSKFWQIYYCTEVLSADRKMHQKLLHICLTMINRKTPIILQDNARSHVTQITLQKLNKLGYEILPHPHTHLICCQQIFISLST